MTASPQNDLLGRPGLLVPSNLLFLVSPRPSLHALASALVPPLYSFPALHETVAQPVSGQTLAARWPNRSVQYEDRAMLGEQQLDWGLSVEVAVWVALYVEYVINSKSSKEKKCLKKKKNFN